MKLYSLGKKKIDLCCKLGLEEKARPGETSPVEIRAAETDKLVETDPRRMASSPTPVSSGVELPQA